MKTEERSRHTVWMEDTVWQRVQEQYKQDGCSTQNEFIAKAILFYCGYFLDLSIVKRAASCTAYLMEYRNKRFPGYTSDVRFSID